MKDYVTFVRQIYTIHTHSGTHAPKWFPVTSSSNILPPKGKNFCPGETRYRATILVSKLTKQLMKFKI